MRSFTATATRKREAEPLGTYTWCFPHPRWFMMTFIFWLSWRRRDEFPRMHPDGTTTRIGLNARGKGIVSLTFDEAMYTKRVIRK